MDKTAIRNAATVVMLRDRSTAPKVLMGQRGATAAFMPNKFVFPGGAVDPDDGDIPFAHQIDEPCASRLMHETPPELVPAIVGAAIREIWEETGLLLGEKGNWPTQPHHDWASFAATGHLPSARGLNYIFRAITPPGRPRRFDARFFLLDADQIESDLDDFSRACDELSHIQWIPIEDVRNFNLPFITEVVMAEVSALVQNGGCPDSVPFFRNDDEESLFLRLKGGSPLDSMIR